MSRAAALVVFLALGCAAVSEEVAEERPDTKPIAGAQMGKGDDPTDDPATGGAAGEGAGAGGAAGAPGNGDVGDEGAECGTKTCAADESCCGGSFCYPAGCTDCCAPPAQPGGGGAGGGGAGGGSAGGGSAGGGSGGSGALCAGQCGSTKAQGPGCYCDTLCIANLDCCPDFFTSCL
jgi:hypothetical protein